MRIDMNVVRNELSFDWALMLAFMWDQMDICCPPHENQLIT